MEENETDVMERKAIKEFSQTRASNTAEFEIVDKVPIIIPYFLFVLNLLIIMFANDKPRPPAVKKIFFTVSNLRAPIVLYI
jgi:hypothetical protein